MAEIDYDPVESPEDEEERKRREGDYPPVEIPARPNVIIPKDAPPPGLDVPGVPSPETIKPMSSISAAPSAKLPLIDHSRPQWSDYAPVQKHGWGGVGQKLGEFFLGTQSRAEDRAERAYKNATAEYEAPLKEEQEKATTQHAQAETEALKRSSKDEGKTVLTDKGVMQWNPKTSRYDIAVGGAPVKEELQGKTQVVGDKVMQWNPESKKYDIEVGPAPTKENASEFEKKYLDLDQKKRMGQPLTPEEQAFHAAYEHHKSMNTQISVNAADSRQEKTFNHQDVREHEKNYIQPAEAVEKSYQMMNNAYNDYKAAKAQGKELPTGAESMLALSTHLATTFGNVKGARVTKDMIEHHLGARGISDSAVVAVQKLTNGDVLSPDQWEAFHKLIGESRKLQWQTAAKEADRHHIPVDFLPEDLKNTSHEPGKADSGPAKKNDPLGIL